MTKLIFLDGTEKILSENKQREREREEAVDYMQDLSSDQGEKGRILRVQKRLIPLGLYLVLRETLQGPPMIFAPLSSQERHSDSIEV